MTKSVFQLIFTLVLCTVVGMAIGLACESKVPTRFKVYVWIAGVLALITAEVFS